MMVSVHHLSPLLWACTSVPSWWEGLGCKREKHLSSSFPFPFIVIILYLVFLACNDVKLLTEPFLCARVCFICLYVYGVMKDGEGRQILASSTLHACVLYICMYMVS